MIEWADEVRTSEKIFLRASTAGKRSFWGYEGAVLEKGDERVVTFPFPTRRPVSRYVPGYESLLSREREGLTSRPSSL